MRSYKGMNIWVSILRIFMCFVVIQDHFLTKMETPIQKGIGWFSWYAVSAFMFLSFYFMSEFLWNADTDKVMKRVQRLVIPIAFWTTIIYILRALLSLDRADIKWYLGALFGIYEEAIPTAFWFMFSQIIIACIIFVVFYLCKGKFSRPIAIAVMIILPYVFQYMGGLTEWPGVAQGTINLLPVSVLGILFARYRNRIKPVLLIVGEVVFIVVAYMSRYLPYPGFSFYCGIDTLLIPSAICILFLILPDCFHGNVAGVINWIGSCTMGIYCTHFLNGQIFNKFFENKMLQGTLWFDLAIFVTGLAVASLIKWISARLKWKWLSYVA